MIVYLDGIAIAWPIAFEAGTQGWVDVWVSCQCQLPFNRMLYRLHGSVTIVKLEKTVDLPVWLP